jgi:flagellar motility protein MotE (MotC chaperone)
MAENNLGMAPEDPKAAKKRLAAEKKEYKKKLKEQRKEQKLKEEEFAERTAEINGDNAGGFATLVITFLIIIIWLAIMALLIKLDVGHFGSEILAPLLKDIPYVNLILPEGSVQKSAPSESQVDYSAAGSSASGIESIEEANAVIKKLEESLGEEISKSNAYREQVEKLQREVTVLEPFRDNQEKFYEDKEKFSEEVVFGDNAPDASAYASYYEMIDPDNAARIYEKIKQDEADDAAIQAFAKTYSGMKAKKAAEIFDEMVEENQIELVAKILAKMSVDNRGSILAAMTKEHSAKLTQLLEPPALEKESTKITR